MSEKQLKDLNIYELDAELSRLLFLVEEGEIDDEEFIKQLTKAEDGLEKKFEGYYKYIEHLKYLLANNKAEVKRLQYVAKLIEKRTERVKAGIAYFLVKYGTQQTCLGTMYTKPTESVEIIIDDKDVPKEYKTMKEKWDVSKTLVREALESSDPEVVSKVSGWASIKKKLSVVLMPARAPKEPKQSKLKL